MKTIKACIDKELPGDMERLAAQLAYEQGLAGGQPARTGRHPCMAAGQHTQRPLPGGETSIQERVEHYAHEWEQHANIKLRFVTEGLAVLRIAFIKGAGSWSYRAARQPASLVQPARRP